MNRRLVELARTPTAKGLVALWTLIDQRYVPAHVASWAREVYAARENGKGAVIEGFRGSLKSTFLNFLALHSLGCFPDREVTLIRANDESGEEGAKFMAGIIENSDTWRAIFPHVRPDTQAGWAQTGYQVMDTRVRYGRWREMRTPTPSLLSLGYTNRGIIGKHPTGLLGMDDLHTSSNIRGKELQSVLERHDSELLQLPHGHCQMIYTGTPWGLGDVLQTRAKQNPQLIQQWTPVVAGNTPTWPEEFPLERIEQLRAIMPPHAFQQMYMLSLTAASGLKLQADWLQEFPHESIDDSWPATIGVDPAFLRTGEDAAGRSYFAMAVLRKNPHGYLILEKGFRDHVSQARAKDLAISWGDAYGSQMAAMGIEDVGVGKVFHDILWGEAKRWPLKKVKLGNRAKTYRIESELAPLFQTGKILISDDPRDKFLAQFRDEWLSYDGMGSYTMDCLDAVYVAAAAARGFVQRAALTEFDFPKGPPRKNPLHKFAK